MPARRAHGGGRSTLLAALGASAVLLAALAALAIAAWTRPGRPSAAPPEGPRGTSRSGSTAGPGSRAPAGSAGDAPAATSLLRGRVNESATGSPVEGALVLVVFGRLPEEQALAAAEAALADPGSLPAGAAASRSDAQGSFLEPLEGPGTFSVAAAHADFLPAARELAVAPGTTVATVELRLVRRLARIRGTVRSSGGPPGPASVHLLGTDGSLRNAEVGPDGSFDLDRVPPGQRTVVLRAKDAEGDPIELLRSFDLEPGDDLELDFDDLAGKTALVGRVHGPAEPGDPVFLCQQAGAATVWRDTRVRAGGTFRFAGVEPDRYYLIVGPRVQEVDVAGGEEVLVDVVVPEGSLRGSVLDPDGSPVPSARVAALPAGLPFDRALLARLAVEARTDAEGRFVLEPLDDAKYELEVSAPGLVPHRLQVDAGGARPLELKLERPGR
ncbi:MAG: carboxypeptidase regulatory-like domain-containing protein [Planctomycetes bacterium]|nr:carboxypeptidase regulatory-like domain-containing protein [Planctomycetota bacterium]